MREWHIRPRVTLTLATHCVDYFCVLLYDCLGAVRANPLTTAATDADIELCMKEWLKHAAKRDRYGSRVLVEQL